MSQPSATPCSEVPINEIAWPHQNSRKLRERRAGALATAVDHRLAVSASQRGVAARASGLVVSAMLLTRGEALTQWLLGAIALQAIALQHEEEDGGHNATEKARHQQTTSAKPRR